MMLAMMKEQRIIYKRKTLSMKYMRRKEETMNRHREEKMLK